MPLALGSVAPVWGRDDCDNSSNWKEFENLVSTLEDELKPGSQRGSLLILAVDNSIVENCIYKGNSSSEKLFDLILRFKDLELKSVLCCRLCRTLLDYRI